MGAEQFLQQNPLTPGAAVLPLVERDGGRGLCGFGAADAYAAEQPVALLLLL